MARSFEEIQATGTYETDEERHIYLTELQRRGVNIAPEARDWLNQYEQGVLEGLKSGEIPNAASGQFPQTSSSTSPTQQQQQATTQGLNIDPGLPLRMQEREDAVRKYIADVQARTTQEINQLDANTRLQLQEREARLQRDLLERRITSEEFQQKRALAQQESEFARSIALQTLIADRDYEINQATLELNKMAEIRQERALQAQLAANPTDFVAYEFYKRSLGNPEAWDSAQRAATSGNVATATGTNSLAQTNMIGEPYAAAPPAYSDNALQQVAEGLFNQPGQQYNPNLGGTGVFGSTIESPNQLSRAEAQGLTDQEMGILASFLKAGIDVGGGQRVGIDPNEWFQQSEQSWVPTLAGIGTQTQYR